MGSKVVGTGSVYLSRVVSATHLLPMHPSSGRIASPPNSADMDDATERKRGVARMLSGLDCGRKIASGSDDVCQCFGAVPGLA